MNKQELTKSIATGANVQQEVAARVLDTLTESIQNALAHGEKVSIRGFGTLTISDRASRIYHHPQSGEKRVARAYCTVRFIPSQNLKMFVN